METPSFSQEEKTRYSRQTILKMVGLEGQARLKAARVLIIGAGGLGSSPAIYLAAAGVGTIGLMDEDTVSLSNLHRQILHHTSDIGKLKVASASEKLKDINPHTHVITYPQRLNVNNALEILADYDLIIDGTDNLPSRYLINDACFLLGKPFIYGGVHQFEGQCSLFGLPGPCYRCFFGEAPPPNEMPSCAEAGVIGVLPGIIGLLQANEAIKWICKIGEPLSGRLLIFEALSTKWREVKINKNPDCPLCGSHPTIHDLEEQSMTSFPEEITVGELKELRDKDPDLYLLDVREQFEWEITHIQGAHLKPLSSLAENFGDIPKDKPVYCYCKIGGRSAHAVQFLKSKGYSQVANVLGGIQAWSQDIDPTIADY